MCTHMRSLWPSSLRCTEGSEFNPCWSTTFYPPCTFNGCIGGITLNISKTSTLPHRLVLHTIPVSQGLCWEVSGQPKVLSLVHSSVVPVSETVIKESTHKTKMWYCDAPSLQICSGRLSSVTHLWQLLARKFSCTFTKKHLNSIFSREVCMFLNPRHANEVTH